MSDLFTDKELDELDTRFKRAVEDKHDAYNETINRLRGRVAELEDRLFARGEMFRPPCFCCGYNGKKYYQPSVHPCAERHHAAIKGDNDE